MVPEPLIRVLVDDLFQERVDLLGNLLCPVPILYIQLATNEFVAVVSKTDCIRDIDRQLPKRAHKPEGA